MNVPIKDIELQTPKNEEGLAVLVGSLDKTIPQAIVDKFMVIVSRYGKVEIVDNGTLDRKVTLYTRLDGTGADQNLARLKESINTDPEARSTSGGGKVEVNFATGKSFEDIKLATTGKPNLKGTLNSTPQITKITKGNIRGVFELISRKGSNDFDARINDFLDGLETEYVGVKSSNPNITLATFDVQIDDGELDAYMPVFFGRALGSKFSEAESIQFLEKTNNYNLLNALKIRNGNFDDKVYLLERFRYLVVKHWLKKQLEPGKAKFIDQKLFSLVPTPATSSSKFEINKLNIKEFEDAILAIIKIIGRDQAIEIFRDLYITLKNDPAFNPPPPLTPILANTFLLNYLRFMLFPPTISPMETGKFQHLQLVNAMELLHHGNTKKSENSPEEYLEEILNVPEEISETDLPLYLNAFRLISTMPGVANNLDKLVEILYNPSTLRINSIDIILKAVEDNLKTILIPNLKKNILPQAYLKLSSESIYYLEYLINKTPSQFIAKWKEISDLMDASFAIYQPYGVAKDGMSVIDAVFLRVLNFQLHSLTDVEYNNFIIYLSGTNTTPPRDLSRIEPPNPVPQNAGHNYKLNLGIADRREIEISSDRSLIEASRAISRNKVEFAHVNPDLNNQLNEAIIALKTSGVFSKLAVFFNSTSTAVDKHTVIINILVEELTRTPRTDFFNIIYPAFVDLLKTTGFPNDPSKSAILNNEIRVYVALELISNLIGYESKEGYAMDTLDEHPNNVTKYNKIKKGDVPKKTAQVLNNLGNTTRKMVTENEARDLSIDASLIEAQVILVRNIQNEISRRVAGGFAPLTINDPFIPRLEQTILLEIKEYYNLSKQELSELEQELKIRGTREIFKFLGNPTMFPIANLLELYENLLDMIYTTMGGQQKKRYLPDKPISKTSANKAIDNALERTKAKLEKGGTATLATPDVLSLDATKRDDVLNNFITKVQGRLGGWAQERIDKRDWAMRKFRDKDIKKRFGDLINDLNNKNPKNPELAKTINKGLTNLGSFAGKEVEFFYELEILSELLREYNLQEPEFSAIVFRIITIPGTPAPGIPADLSTHFAYQEANFALERKKQIAENEERIKRFRERVNELDNIKISPQLLTGGTVAAAVASSAATSPGIISVGFSSILQARLYYYGNIISGIYPVTFLTNAVILGTSVLITKPIARKITEADAELITKQNQIKLAKLNKALEVQPQIISDENKQFVRLYELQSRAMEIDIKYSNALAFLRKTQKFIDKSDEAKLKREALMNSQVARLHIEFSRLLDLFKRAETEDLDPKILEAEFQNIVSRINIEYAALFAEINSIITTITPEINKVTNRFNQWKKDEILEEGKALAA